MYNGYIVYLENVRPAENSDNLNLCDVFGNTVVVDKKANEKDLYIYFPCDGQLSLEFCINNNLLRKLPDGTPGPGYMDLDKRNVKAIKLRGNKSDGIVLPISSLNYCFKDNDAESHFSVGDKIDIVNGKEICTKYVPRGNGSKKASENGNRVRKKRVPLAPLFLEHVDTEQLAYNLDAFQPKDVIEITLKVHGTSGRTAYLPVLKGFKRSLLERLLRKEGTPIYDWGYVSGTRRTVLENYEGGFHGSNAFREEHSKTFEGKLLKGETVYFEICGYITDGTPIMPSGKNKRLNDEEFVKKYGDITEFSYGCDPKGENGKPQSRIFVYRMTMTNEDGDVVEYSPELVRYRCEQMGVETVPVLSTFIIPDVVAISAGGFVKRIAEEYYDDVDPIGKTHIREGVVVRIVNRPKFTAFKHKNFNFKCLSGIISENVAKQKNIEMSDDMLAEI